MKAIMSRYGNNIRETNQRARHLGIAALFAMVAALLSFGVFAGETTIPLEKKRSTDTVAREKTAPTAADTTAQETIPFTEAPAAASDEAAAEAAAAETREELAQAKSLIAAEDFGGALTLLKSAFDRTPSSLIMFNIAMCEKALSRHVAAVAAFHRFLELQAQDTAKNETLTVMAKEALRDLYPLVGALTVTHAPDGAAISVDDEVRGEIPLPGPIYVMPGRHTVVVAKPGLAPMEVDINVAGGAEVPIRADLNAPMSHIEVDCDDPKATVILDGEPVGPCPYRVDLPEGTYEVTVSAPEKETVVEKVTATARRTTVISVKLKPVIDLAKLTPPPAPFDLSRDRRWVLGTGISATVLGVLGVASGIVFGVRYNSRAQTVNDNIETINTHHSDYDSDQTHFNNENTQQSYNDAFDKMDRNIEYADSDRAAFITSYVVGGLFVALGTGILTHYFVTKRKDKRHDITIRPGGVDVAF